MTRAQKFIVRLARREQLSVKFFLVGLKLVQPGSLSFAPGQYISLKVGPEKYNSYSITSLPEQASGVEICVDISPGGKGAEFVRKAPIGTETEMLAPLGRFSLSQEKKPALFLATGSGISPFRPMIARRLSTGQEKVWLYWGLRFDRDLFWTEQWEKWKKHHSQFAYKLCLSQPKSDWRGYVGRITDAVKADFGRLTGWEAYLCGNGGMIEEMGLILKDKGIDVSSIYTEKFF